MSETTTQRKPRQHTKAEVTRTIRMIIGLNEYGRCGLFRITEVTHLLKGPKVKVDEYFLDKIPSDFGEAFLVEKRDYRPLQEGEEESRYHVLIANEQDRSCECKGFLRHGHCRHITGLLALRARKEI
jgi:hypothetical protein